jgi:peptide-methionine (R)-S-oxide reductase
MTINKQIFGLSAAYFVCVSGITTTVTMQSCYAADKPSHSTKRSANMKDAHPKVIKTDAEWRKLLTPDQFEILRNRGTELPGSGSYLHHSAPGQYHCAACDAALFNSGGKYDSHCGWPSFYEPIPGALETLTDRTHGMVRTEIRCARCEGHIGHVFSDGPMPTGERYCTNSVALKFKPLKF